MISNFDQGQFEANCLHVVKLLDHNWSNTLHSSPIRPFSTLGTAGLDCQPFTPLPDSWHFANLGTIFAQAGISSLSINKGFLRTSTYQPKAILDCQTTNQILAE